MAAAVVSVNEVDLSCMLTKKAADWIKLLYYMYICIHARTILITGFKFQYTFLQLSVQWPGLCMAARLELTLFDTDLTTFVM